MQARLNHSPPHIPIPTCVCVFVTPSWSFLLVGSAQLQKKSLFRGREITEMQLWLCKSDPMLCSQRYSRFVHQGVEVQSSVGEQVLSALSVRLSLHWQQSHCSGTSDSKTVFNFTSLFPFNDKSPRACFFIECIFCLWCYVLIATQEKEMELKDFIYIFVHLYILCALTCFCLFICIFISKFLFLYKVNFYILVYLCLYIYILVFYVYVFAFILL